MPELPRRTFGALAAATAGALAGCQFPDPPDLGEVDDVVRNRTELAETFADLSPGQTVHITADDAPYRTREWLDVDVNGVTLVGPGIRRLVVPADGADVGGIRIGHEERCRDVDVRGVGYHGNPDSQSASASRLHGIAVRDAENVTLVGNHVAATHPQRHGDGGSGISVARPCTDVEIRGNRVRTFGDRGVQIAGERVVVAGNVVTRGLDRPVSCDLWPSTGTNRTAHNVSVYGNVLGQSLQGSLVGVAKNGSSEPAAGPVSFHGNLGFGPHKSFCHVRGPHRLRNVNVQNNVSVQEAEGLQTEETKQFSGITVDPAGIASLSVKDNDLYGYSGHGIRVDSDAMDLAIQDNAITSPGLGGITMSGASDGMVAGNSVIGTGGAGIHLDGTPRLSVAGNYLRRIGGVGVRLEGGGDIAGTEVAGNYVAGTGRSGDGQGPGVLVRGSGVRVRDNAVRDTPGHAIAEEGPSDGPRNRYDGNWSDDDSPWRFRRPSSHVRNHEPPVDVHRDIAADGTTVGVSFDRPYERPPRLAFARDGGGVRGRSFERDGRGNVVGVTLEVAREGGTVDVFVDHA